MHLSPEEIEEFRQIYKDESGEVVSEEEASEMGSRLLRLYEVFLDIAERMVLEKEARGAKVEEGDASARPGRDITNQDNDESHQS